VPLYHHYPSSPDAIDGCASRLFSNAGVLRGLMTDVQARTGLARGQVSGLLAPPMAVVDDPTVTTCAKTAQGSLWAAGAVRFFSGSVRTFNDGVDQLNAEWDAAVADDFGVQPPYLLPTTSPESAQQMQTDHTAEVSAARAARKARLDGLYAELEEALDKDATLVGGMLDRGPNPTDGGRLFEAGVLQPLGSELSDAYNPVDVSGGALLAPPSSSRSTPHAPGCATSSAASADPRFGSPPAAGERVPGSRPGRCRTTSCVPRRRAGPPASRSVVPR